MLRLRQPVANPTGAHDCVVAYTPLWWTGEEASWCLLQPKYARGNSTAVAASSQAVHRTAEAVLTSLRYSHSTNSTTSLMSCTFDLWWQLYSSCLKLPHVAAVIRPREVPPASNLTGPSRTPTSFRRRRFCRQPSLAAAYSSGRDGLYIHPTECQPTLSRARPKQSLHLR